MMYVGTHDTTKKDRLITRDVALVMTATFFFMTSNMVVTPIIAGYGESLGAAGTLMGTIAGAMSFVSLFCRPIAGNLSDLVSKRLLVASGTLLYIIAGVMYYAARSTGMLIAARMINGLGFACGTVCLATWVSLLLPIRHMGAGMGLYGSQCGFHSGRPGARHPPAHAYRISPNVHSGACAQHMHVRDRSAGQKRRCSSTYTYRQPEDVPKRGGKSVAA